MTHTLSMQVDLAELFTKIDCETSDVLTALAESIEREALDPARDARKAITIRRAAGLCTMIDEATEDYELAAVPTDEELEYSAKLESMGYSKERGFDLKVRHPVVHVMIQELVAMFEAQGGKNYVEFSILHPEKGEFTLTIQRKAGKAPGELKAELEERMQQIRDILIDSSGKYENELDRHLAINSIVNPPPSL